MNDLMRKDTEDSYNLKSLQNVILNIAEYVDKLCCEYGINYRLMVVVFSLPLAAFVQQDVKKSITAIVFIRHFIVPTLFLGYHIAICIYQVPIVTFRILYLKQIL